MNEVICDRCRQSVFVRDPTDLPLDWAATVEINGIAHYCGYCYELLFLPKIYKEKIVLQRKPRPQRKSIRKIRKRR